MGGGGKKGGGSGSGGYGGGGGGWGWSNSNNSSQSQGGWGYNQGGQGYQPGKGKGGPWSQNNGQGMVMNAMDDVFGFMREQMDETKKTKAEAELQKNVQSSVLNMFGASGGASSGSTPLIPVPTAPQTLGKSLRKLCGFPSNPAEPSTPVPKMTAAEWQARQPPSTQKGKRNRKPWDDDDDEDDDDDDDDEDDPRRGRKGKQRKTDNLIKNQIQRAVTEALGKPPAAAPQARQGGLVFPAPPVDGSGAPGTEGDGTDPKAILQAWTNPKKKKFCDSLISTADRAAFSHSQVNLYDALVTSSSQRNLKALLTANNIPPGVSQAKAELLTKAILAMDGSA
jgi:hypothetical protein